MLKNIFKNKFFLSTIILLVGGTFSKLLGFFLKIIITREIGTEGIGLYSMLSPTTSLFTILAIFSFPIAVSKLVSSSKIKSKNILLACVPISIIINTLLITFAIFFAPFISSTLLHEERLYFPIICSSLILPFISLSSIIKGYFWGRQNMLPYILSNIIEQIVRIIILITLIPYLLKKSIILTICAIILVNIISETSSIIVMLLFVPKSAKITKEDLKSSTKGIKDVLGITLPATSSKIVGSIAYFFEPIILTNSLLLMGYSNEYILLEYGIINGYALSLLILPQFFSQSLSTSLIPEISKYYSLGNKKKCKIRIKQICSISFLIGLIFTIFIFLFPEFLLNMLFKTTKGYKYIKILAPFTLLYFIEIPLVHSLQAMGKESLAMNITIITSIIRLSLLFILSLLKIGMYSLIFTIIINLLVTTYLYLYYVRKELK